MASFMKESSLPLQDQTPTVRWEKSVSSYNEAVCVATFLVLVLTHVCHHLLHSQGAIKIFSEPETSALQGETSLQAASVCHLLSAVQNGRLFCFWDELPYPRLFPLLSLRITEGRPLSTFAVTACQPSSISSAWPSPVCWFKGDLRPTNHQCFLLLPDSSTIQPSTHPPHLPAAWWIHVLHRPGPRHAMQTCIHHM